MAYLKWMGEAATRYDCAIHAYVLMTNHIHILVTPNDRQSVGRMMQYIGRHYVPYINHNYGSSGSIWEGRYKASLIHDEEYLLTCIRYIELNPVRANMVSSPLHYRWSSYRGNAQGKEDPQLTMQPLYTLLGKDISSRCKAYKALFKAHIDEEDLRGIRSAWQTGTPLGNDYFKEKIEKRLQARVGFASRGRPKRALTS